ncbi:hypothetical protein [Nocardia sp. NPDC057030]|uniref:hypothetical protein n=1 Tax=unclassified Nocardia TaxID=2637762 RepID=UPI00363F33E6
MSDSGAGDGAEMQAMVTRWQALKKQAEGGELRLDEQIGTLLASRADQMRTKLQTMVDQAGDLSHISGFGTLASAEALQAKFSKKADGGDDAAVKRLQQSIEVVKLMSDTYKLAIGKIVDSDQAAADRLAGLGVGDS